MPTSNIPIPTHNEKDIENCTRYLFNEFNAAQDGRMTRKDFFTFLWDLKTTSKQTLNEGQMMSCWLAVSRRAETVGFQEFRDGLELCYENLFFYRENDADPPNLELNAINAYDTVRMKNSVGVKAFDQLLKDEKQGKEKPTGRPMTLYGQPKPSKSSGSTNPRPVMDVPRPARTERAERPPREEREQPDGRPPVAARPDRPAVAAKPKDLQFTTSAKVKIDMLQKEREVKKMEAQRKMDDILAQRFQEQKRQRELERQRQEEEKSRQRVAEADALSAEPAWMQNLKGKKRF